MAKSSGGGGRGGGRGGGGGGQPYSARRGQRVVDVVRIGQTRTWVVDARVRRRPVTLARQSFRSFGAAKAAATAFMEGGSYGPAVGGLR